MIEDYLSLKLQLHILEGMSLPTLHICRLKSLPMEYADNNLPLLTQFFNMIVNIWYEIKIIQLIKPRKFFSYFDIKNTKINFPDWIGAV